jgi:hypothetical protein
VADELLPDHLGEIRLETDHAGRARKQGDGQAFQFNAHGLAVGPEVIPAARQQQDQEKEQSMPYHFGSFPIAGFRPQSNPNFEIRNPKRIQMLQCPKHKPGAHCFGHSNLGHGLEFRASDFEFSITSKIPYPRQETYTTTLTSFCPTTMTFFTGF